MGASADWINHAVTLLTSGGVLAIAKYFLAQSARQLEEIPKNIQSITVELAKMEVHLGELAKVKETVREHDRMLAILMARSPDYFPQTGQVVSSLGRRNQD